MFSTAEKRAIADAVQQILRATAHPELPAGEINFLLHVEGAESWSWADIRNNGAIGKSIRTGGVSALTLARLVTCAWKFDYVHHARLCLERDMPILYHCTEDEGQRVLAHLAATLKALTARTDGTDAE